jgi:hypothetical protein
MVLKLAFSKVFDTVSWDALFVIKRSEESMRSGLCGRRNFLPVQKRLFLGNWTNIKRTFLQKKHQKNLAARGSVVPVIVRCGG